MTKEEFEEFVDTGYVSLEHLNRIANLVKMHMHLSKYDFAIFICKTNKINEIIQDSCQ